ncbi:MAG TPA: TIM barrel protein [Patescibacteria group bacterium]|nr:TIM barrel protein [Patescibacteria group bacterium]
MARKKPSTSKRVKAALSHRSRSRRLSAARSATKLGVTLYSYGGDLHQGFMSLEDCIADVADMGGVGIEILGESHVPDYPNPSARWVKQWFGWMEKYHTKPSAYDLFVDTMFYKKRLLTVDEAVEYLLLDFKLAHRLGFKVLRQQWAPYPADNPADQMWAPYVKSTPAMEVIEKALPYAERYDLKMAVELHSPTQLQSPWMDSCLEFIAKTKTKHFGFTPDMSIFTRRPPRHREAQLFRAGARPEIISYIRKAYQNHLGPEKTVAEVTRMKGNAQELRWASIAGVYHFSDNDPKDLLPLLPYSYHIHGKLWEMTDDLREYSIAYEEVVPVLKEGGFQGYISSEYEGSRVPGDASEQIRRHQLMLRRLLGVRNGR